jgi:hypothetical protein
MIFPLLSHSDSRKRNIMASRFNNSAAALALGIAFFPATALLNTGTPFGIRAVNQEFIRFQTLADETDAVALQVAFESSAPTMVVDAYEALQTDPSNVTLQDDYNQAVADAALPDARVTRLETAYAVWQNAVEADALAAVAEAEALDARNVAANF